MFVHILNSVLWFGFLVNGLTMTSLLMDLRDVGDNIVSTSQDIKMLLDMKDCSDTLLKTERLRLARDLVDNILSLVAYLTTLHYRDLDKFKELEDEIRKIEFACFEGRSVMTQIIEEFTTAEEKEKDIGRILRTVDTSAKKITSLSFIAKEVTGSNFQRDEGNEKDNHDYCYQSKDSCEEDCFDGICYEDSFRNDFTADVCYKDEESCQKDCLDGTCYKDNYENLEFLSTCPEYTESFTPSPHTHVESGYEEPEEFTWSKPGAQPSDIDNKISEDKLSSNSDHNNNLATDTVFWTDKCKEEECPAKKMSEFETDCIDRINIESAFQRKTLQFQTFLDEISKLEEDDVARENEQKYETFVHKENQINRDNDLFKSDEAISKNSQGTGFEILNEDKTTEKSISLDSTISNLEDSNVDSRKHYPVDSSLEPGCDSTSCSHDDSTTAEQPASNYESTTEIPQTTLPYYEEFSTTTELPEAEATTESYNAYTTEEPTTPSCETTTQDLYKVSQDIYSAAQDLSSKASEISSMSSDISSKVSDISSLVSDLNSYDNDELSKKVQRVSKLTQEISSKTSEISSLSSTTSSLSSDISSASSDITSADRNHAFRTSPWQKMTNKCQDMITALQGVVSAAQEVLIRVAAVEELTADLSVAAAVATASYDVTARCQALISETLRLQAAVIELVSNIEA